MKWLENISLLAEKEFPFLLSQVRPADRPRHILFWIASAWSYTVVDCILAIALRLRGHHVTLLLCNGLPHCEDEQIGGIKRNCAKCLAVKLSYVNAFKLPYLMLSEFITSDAVHEANLLKTITSENLQKLEISKINVGELAQVSTCYFQGLPGVPGDLLWPLVDKSLFVSACMTGVLLTRAAEEAFKKLTPDTFVSVGGKSVMWAPMFEIAENQRLSTVNWEDFSVHPNGFVFSHHQPAIRGYLEDVWSHEKDKELNESQEEELNKLFKAWENSEATPFKYYNKRESSAGNIRNELAIKCNSHVISVFPNILREDNIMQGGRQAAFNNQVEWLLAIIDLAKSDYGCTYLIRLHPAEAKLPSDYILHKISEMLAEYCPKLPDNVRIIPAESAISSYALGEMANAILIWTGTLGLEFALKGRKVIVCGDAGYRKKGFTVDVSSDLEMSAAINQYINDRFISAKALEYAKRYAYIIRFRNIIKLPFHSGHKTREFYITSFSDLITSGNKIINELCDRIIARKYFLDINAPMPNKIVM